MVVEYGTALTARRGARVEHSRALTKRLQHRARVLHHSILHVHCVGSDTRQGEHVTGPGAYKDAVRCQIARFGVELELALEKLAILAPAAKDGFGRHADVEKVWPLEQ